MTSDMAIEKRTHDTALSNTAHRLPGEVGIWVFVLFDLVFFALLFLSYVIERAGNPVLFAESQRRLDVGLGLINTLILLTSSWLVALAVHIARVGASKLCARCLWAAALCGSAFISIKLVEYGTKFHAGISMLTNDFFMFYFAMTFIHFVHVIVGTVVLLVVAAKARRGDYQGGNVKGIETAGIYWHMVDLLWVMLFPLIYLSSAA